MFGLKTQRRKHAAVFNVMAMALDIADTTQFMLGRKEFAVRERLNTGKAVEVGSLTTYFNPPNGAKFSKAQLWQMGRAIDTSFSAQLFPVRFLIRQDKAGHITATIHPARS